MQGDVELPCPFRVSAPVQVQDKTKELEYVKVCTSRISECHLKEPIGIDLQTKQVFCGPVLSDAVSYSFSGFTRS
jgi:hypothetical protein